MLWRHLCRQGTIRKQEALVEKLVPVLEHDGEETAADFKERLLRVSNRKLLRLWQRHSCRAAPVAEALVGQIVQAKLGRADADLKAS